MKQGRGYGRRIAATFCIGIVVLGMFSVKVAYQSYKEFARGEAALKRQKIAEALSHYERAIKWYTPLSPSVSRAVARLWDIAVKAEQGGELGLALAAYRTLRASLYAIRSIYLPSSAWIPKCEARIARLMAMGDEAAREGTATRSQAVARYTAMLQRDTAPKIGWALVLELGFVGWITATAGFIWFGFTAHGSLGGRRALLWGGLMVIGFAAWIVGMALA